MSGPPDGLERRRVETRPWARAARGAMASLARGGGGKKRREDITLLWQRYVAKRRAEDRDALLGHYDHLVDQVVAAALRRHRAGATLDRDDLRQEALLGLLAAIEARAAETAEAGGVAEAGFEDLARARMHQALVQAARSEDALPRGARRHLRELREAFDDLVRQQGREPSEDEVRTALALADATARQVTSAAAFARRRHFSALRAMGVAVEELVADEAPGPESVVERAVLISSLLAALERLSERDIAVITWSFVHHLSLQEIGARLGVSKTRAHQLLERAMARLGEEVRGSVRPAG